MSIKKILIILFKPYRSLFSNWTRDFLKKKYSSKKILRHDIKSDLRTKVLKPLNDLLVGNIPEDYKIHNGQIDFNSKGSVMSIQSYYTGEIEYHLTQYLIKNTIKDDMVFLDIGGHHGAFSAIVAYELKKNNLKGSIFTFEPSEENRNFLIRNLEKNNLTEFVTLIPKGVSDHSGKQSFFESTDNSCNTLLDKEVEDYNSIEVISLDDFCKDFKRVDLIKMDIQGGEYEALLGAEKILKKFKPILLVEIMNYTVTSQKSKSFLQSIGYNLYYLDKDSNLVNENDPSVFVSWDVIAIPS